MKCIQCRQSLRGRTDLDRHMRLKHDRLLVPSLTSEVYNSLIDCFLYAERVAEAWEKEASKEDKPIAKRFKERMKEGRQLLYDAFKEII